MGEVASAYVSVYPKIANNFGTQLQTQMRKSSAGAFGPIDAEGKKAGAKAASTFGSSFKNVVGPMMALASVGAISSFVKSSVDSFSQLEDATAAASVTFGDAMDKIQAKADGASAALGISKQQYIDGALSMGTFGKSAGLTGDDLAAFSNQLVQTAGDMASFRGTTPEEAIEAVGSALRGEMEPIRKYGVMLDDASLRQEAMRQGLIETTKEALTPANKVLAVQALILAKTKDAQGDFARTSDSTANVQKRLKAETENFNAALGAKLAPTIVEVQEGLSNLMGVAEDNDAVLGPLTDTARGLATAFHDLTTAMDGGTDAGKALKPFLDAINNITLVKPVQELANAYVGWSNSADGATTAANSNTTAAKANAGATKSITETLADNTTAIQKNIDKINAQYDASLKLRGDKRALEAAIDGATESLWKSAGVTDKMIDKHGKLTDKGKALVKSYRESGKALDIHTEKGRANQAALDEIASSGKAVGGNMEKSRTAFIRAATSMGMAKDEAKALATKLGLIKSKDVTVKVHFSQAEANFKIGLDYFGHKTKKALGGEITGGVAGKDSVPILAMPEEHMLTVDDVRAMGGQQAVYRFRASLHSGGQRFANGGQVGAQSGATPVVSIGSITGIKSDDVGAFVDALMDRVATESRLSAAGLQRS